MSPPKARTLESHSKKLTKRYKKWLFYDSSTVPVGQRNSRRPSLRSRWSYGGCCMAPAPGSHLGRQGSVSGKRSCWVTLSWTVRQFSYISCVSWYCSTSESFWWCRFIFGVSLHFLFDWKNGRISRLPISMKVLFDEVTASLKLSKFQHKRLFQVVYIHFITSRIC